MNVPLAQWKRWLYATALLKSHWQPGLTTWILAGLIGGGIIGWLWPDFGVSLAPLGTIFIHLMLMIVAPLIFSALVVALSGSGPLRVAGSAAWQTLAFALIYTASMLAFGLFLAAWLQPGAGVTLGNEAAAVAVAKVAAEPIWLRLVPSSAIDAMARNDVFQIVFFSVLFGVAVNLTGEKGKPVLEFCRALMEVMFKLTHLAMYAAPLGVGGAMAAAVGRHGLSIGESLLRLVLATYIGLAVMALVLIPGLVWLSGVPLRGFLRAARQPFLLAFSTTSGNVAWPIALENLVRLGLPKTIASFALFTGPFNLAASALFIGIAGSFLIQASGGETTGDGSVVLFATLFLASKSVFGPRGSLLALAAALHSYGMDPSVIAAGFALLVGIDPILDMPRTGINLLGTMTTACLVSRWQGGTVFSPVPRSE